MTKELPFAILPQPTETTCGATCLHAVYSYFGEKFELQQLIDEIPQLPDGGGTRAAYLGLHALKLGYEVRMYTYNLPVFDLTWFRHGEGRDLQRRLRLQLEAKGGDELAEVTEIFCHYLDAGGEIYTEDLTSSLMRRYLKRDIPIITGLSITYLHGSPREIQSTNTP
ncbi:MAG: hypothetical protein H3C47_10195, partial [Candidatus Cloacimonetes bacterium]|nr:hypothetical protein [Candidatus Cloacimonadota bacterium]